MPRNIDVEHGPGVQIVQVPIGSNRGKVQLILTDVGNGEFRFSIDHLNKTKGNRLLASKTFKVWEE